MKTILKTTATTLIFIFFSVILPQRSFSQAIGDTVIFYVDQLVEVKISIHDYSQLGANKEIAEALVSFRNALPTFVKSLSENEPELVRLKPDGTISITPGDPAIIYQQGQGGLVDTGFRDRAIISREDFEITISAGDLSGISELALDRHLLSVVNQLPPKTLRSRTLYFECMGEATTELSDRHVTNPPMEFLELELGAGAGLVKNNWVTDISFGVGVDFNKKGAHRYPYISTNMLFDFSESNQINVNTFLNVGYGWNVTKFSPRKDKLYLELGYLISRQGDLFEENTLRLGFKWAPIKGVYVSPHIYASDGFSNIYPGVRIGFGF
ncbi:MAG: hypothetical protein RIF33_04475 [Cyclobacteriaceae bacterium]